MGHNYNFQIIIVFLSLKIVCALLANSVDYLKLNAASWGISSRSTELSAIVCQQADNSHKI